MTTQAPATIPARSVYTSDRIEFHAPECQHHIPQRADVSTTERPLSWFAEVQAEAKELGTQNPIMPCLRRLIPKGAR